MEICFRVCSFKIIKPGYNLKFIKNLLIESLYKNVKQEEGKVGSRFADDLGETRSN